jgi:MoaA/NifB/PqqE/SkfB family radical SAM enzyme
MSLDILSKYGNGVDTNLEGDVFQRPSDVVEANTRKQMAYVESEGLTNYEVDPRAKFNLGATKIAWYRDRVETLKRAIDSGGIPPSSENRVAPITIDMALTQKCFYSCKFCYAGLQQNPSEPFGWEHFERFLDDCVEIGHKPGEGVKGISLVSDGESLDSPFYYDFIAKGRENGIAMASGTNFRNLDKSKLPGLVGKDRLTYLRVNFEAGEAEAYAQIMGVKPEDFHNVVNNIREAVRIKNDERSDTTIGLQMVLMPQYADQVIPLALLGRELGVDYTVIKHCGDDAEGRLGVDYDWYRSDFAVELLKVAEALSTKDHSVQARWHKMKTGGDRSYNRCFGTPLQLQMSGAGIVAPCGSFFHDRYKERHIGRIDEQTFKDLWNSERYWEVLMALQQPGFNPQTDCTQLCLQDRVNETLFDAFVNGVDLPDVSEMPVPGHIEFI